MPGARQRRHRPLIFGLLLCTMAVGAPPAAEEGDTREWAVPMSHSSGQTVSLIANQVVVLVWKLDLAEVEAELALAGLHRGVGAGVQFGLVLNGEQRRVHDFPADDAEVRWHLAFSSGELDGGVLEAQLYIITPDGDGPVGRMTGRFELRLRHLSDPAHHSEGGVHELDAPAPGDACRAAHLRDDREGEECRASLENARALSDWVAIDQVVPLRRELVDVERQIGKFGLDGFAQDGPSEYGFLTDFPALQRLVGAAGFCG